MLYMCLNIPQIYFKYARCPMTSYHDSYVNKVCIQMLPPVQTLIFEAGTCQKLNIPMPHWLRSEGLHDVPLSRHLWLRCFTTRLQFVCTLVGKWRLFHCSKTPTPALSSRNTSCRRKGLDSAMRALGILMYRGAWWRAKAWEDGDIEFLDVPCVDRSDYVKGVTLMRAFGDTGNMVVLYALLNITKYASNAKANSSLICTK